jgi:hypothetical protein
MKLYRFRSWLRNWIINFDQREMDEDEAVTSISQYGRKRSRLAIQTGHGPESFDAEPIRLSIYSASGGMIVETKTYDRQKDRQNTQLYIINDTEQMGEELNKIITMVSLGR